MIFFVLTLFLLRFSDTNMVIILHCPIFSLYYATLFQLLIQFNTSEFVSVKQKMKLVRAKPSSSQMHFIHEDGLLLPQWLN